MNDILKKENAVWIMPFSDKKTVLKWVRENHSLLKSKIYDLDTLRKEYNGFYDSFALYQVMEEENTSPLMASIYLSYLPYLKEKEYSSSKLKYLQSIQKKIGTKWYHKNPFLEDVLKDKEIILYNYPVLTSEEEDFINQLQHKYTLTRKEKKEKKKKIIYQEYSTTSEEIASIAEQITLLIKEGREPDSIKLFLPNSSYQNEVERIFSLFHIPIQPQKQRSLTSYDMVKYFLSLLESTDSVEALEIVRETYDLKDSFLHTLYESLLEEITPFLSIPKEDQISLFFYLFQKKKIGKNEYTGCIQEISSLEDGSENIVFALGVSAMSFPSLKKEDDYLNEEEKKILGLSCAHEVNQERKEKVFYQMQIPQKLYLSYAHRSPFQEYAISSFIPLLESQNLLQREERRYEFTSYTYNQYLLCRELDTYTKYGEKSDILTLLSSSTEVSYKTYQNAYKGIDTQKLYLFVQNAFTLSYSSLDVFYRCPFRFYLSQILKVREKENTASIRVGNIVHEVLCEYLKEETDLSAIIEDTFKKYSLDASPKETFFFEKYKKELYKLIQVLEEQRKKTDFKEKYLEEEFIEEIKGRCTITLKGYIDKVLTYTEKDKTYAMIVDYKTGTITTNFNPVIYGMGMQLLLYYYLLKKRHPQYELGGVYWQNIMKEVLPAEKGKCYETIIEEAYRLNGYTSKNVNVVRHMDLFLEKSYIKSLKIKKDDSFYAYSKVLSEGEINALLDIVEKKIEEAIQKIENADFTIEPKRIGSEKMEESTGCKFCPYVDICYREAKDVLSLPEYKNLEFIKEVSDGED